MSNLFAYPGLPLGVHDSNTPKLKTNANRANNLTLAARLALEKHRKQKQNAARIPNAE